MRTIDLARLTGSSLRTAASAKKLVKEGKGLAGSQSKVLMVANFYANHLLSKGYRRKLQYNTAQPIPSADILAAFAGEKHLAWIAERVFSDFLVDDLIAMIQDLQIPLLDVEKSFHASLSQKPAMQKFIQSIHRVCQTKKTL
ncbi:hypothetical protein [Wolinella succinogenes]|uniref:Uncharacterized protein n=1 Tax=Wolinella succinogenes (strain ATCC 29543 / DSM 1740 / CCUG 13145 / JCM 31913 / LMG 7466 / NCTC 11488 / FDC 602W) TaxID=273121 RepID=Q7MRD7_WOLSU|nr:hypothetical protein [Wolinella succinogenes]NLU34812.1 hypothetical protein [Wolinella succinogenes]CAE10499.1 hypothetical protein WS1439 [Wolinella succinogenes]VEG80643.1 Uncharacterised protein [Wolinella succinogenes]HCZ19661.1 hypothetical protein [Helicobacter sp.]